MRANLFGHYLVGCLLLVLVSGCTLMQVVKSEKPKMNIDGIVAKIRTTDTNKIIEKKATGIGVGLDILEYYNSRKEEEVYNMVSSKIISQLAKSCISAYLLNNENDPRLENIGIILYIQYFENTKTQMVEQPRGVLQELNEMNFLVTNAASFGNVGNAFAYAAMTSQQTQKITTIEESYVVNIYDMLTGVRGWYDNLETAIKELQRIINGEKDVYERAILNFDKALEVNPRDAQTYNDRGIAYMTKGNYDRAIQDFSKVLEVNPSYVEAYNKRGLAYCKKGEYDCAIFDYNKALEINPNCAGAYTGRGIVYAEKGEYDRAILDYNKALEIDQNYTLAYINRGHSCCFKENLDSAISDYTKALEINPSCAEAYISRGESYVRKGYPERAILDFNKVLSIIPNDAEGYLNTGIAYSWSYRWRKSEGKLKDAISYFNEALKINPSYVEAYIEQGVAYRMAGNYNCAKLNYNRALEINPHKYSEYFWRDPAYRNKR